MVNKQGRFFLQKVESVVGRNRFDVFLKKYFEEFRFKTMNTERFVTYLKTHLLTSKEAADIHIQAWVYGPGLPDNALIPYSQELDRVEEAIAGFNNNQLAASEMNTTGYTTHHWLYFLRGLKNLDSTKMADLDEVYHFTETGNSEVACDWYKHCIEQNYMPGFPAMREFLIRVGRRKFLTPLYTRLAKDPVHKAWAKEVYSVAKKGYHSVSYNTIDQILN